MTHVHVEAKQNESNSSVIRRFTQRARSAGIVRNARGGRYRSRELSQSVKKKNMLKLIDRAKEKERLRKLGKLPE